MTTPVKREPISTRPHGPARHAAVVVTGASSGIGRAAGLALGAHGYHVFGSVRRREDVAALQQAGGTAVTPLLMDVTDAESIDAAVVEIEGVLRERELHLVGLVSNAGAGMMTPVEFLYEDVLRAQLETNLVGHVAVTRRILPLIRASVTQPDAPQRGRIYFVGTGAGLPSPIFPFLSAYMACKWGLEAVCRSLRQELRLRGDPIDVGMLNPGFVRSSMRRSTGRAVAPVLARMPAWARESYGPLIASFGRFGDRQRGSSAEAAARVVVRAMSSRRAHRQYRIGWDSTRHAWLARLPLALQERIVARVYSSDVRTRPDR